MFCSICGERVVEGAKFCQKCGTTVISGNTSQLEMQSYRTQTLPTNCPPPPENYGSRKGKRTIWMIIAACVVVLVLLFGALSLFTDVFKLSKSNGEESNISSTRRKGADDVGTETEPAEKSSPAPSSRGSFFPAVISPESAAVCADGEINEYGNICRNLQFYGYVAQQGKAVQIHLDNTIYRQFDGGELEVL